MNKENDAKRYKMMRGRVVTALGGKCPCGVEDCRALQIDHRDGGGNDHRRTYGGRWRQFYQYVIDNPAQFQILCANCNAIKRIEQSEHKPKKFTVLALPEVAEEADAVVGELCNSPDSKTHSQSPVRLPSS